MYKNGYASVDIGQLAFDKAEVDYEGFIVIPFQKSSSRVFCSSTPPYTAWKSVEIYGDRYEGRVSPDVTTEIYKRLEDYIG